MEEIRWFSLNNDAGMMERVQLENEANMQTMAVLREQIVTLEDQCAATGGDVEAKFAAFEKCKDLEANVKLQCLEVHALNMRIQSCSVDAVRKDAERGNLDAELNALTAAYTLTTADADALRRQVADLIMQLARAKEDRGRLSFEFETKDSTVSQLRDGIPTKNAGSGTLGHTSIGLPEKITDQDNVSSLLRDEVSNIETSSSAAIDDQTAELELEKEKCIDLEKKLKAKGAKCKTSDKQNRLLKGTFTKKDEQILTLSARIEALQATRAAELDVQAAEHDVVLAQQREGIAVKDAMLKRLNVDGAEAVRTISRLRLQIERLAGAALPVVNDQDSCVKRAGDENNDLASKGIKKDSKKKNHSKQFKRLKAVVAEKDVQIAKLEEEIVSLLDCLGAKEGENNSLEERLNNIDTEIALEKAERERVQSQMAIMQYEYTEAIEQLQAKVDEEGTTSASLQLTIAAHESSRPNKANEDAQNGKNDLDRFKECLRLAIQDDLGAVQFGVDQQDSSIPTETLLQNTVDMIATLRNSASQSVSDLQNLQDHFESATVESQQFQQGLRVANEQKASLLCQMNENTSKSQKSNDQLKEKLSNASNRLEKLVNNLGMLTPDRVRLNETATAKEDEIDRLKPQLAVAQAALEKELSQDVLLWLAELEDQVKQMTEEMMAERESHEETKTELAEMSEQMQNERARQITQLPQENGMAAAAEIERLQVAIDTKEARIVSLETDILELTAQVDGLEASIHSRRSARKHSLQALHEELSGNVLQDIWATHEFVDPTLHGQALDNLIENVTNLVRSLKVTVATLKQENEQLATTLEEHKKAVSIYHNNEQIMKAQLAEGQQPPAQNEQQQAAALASVTQEKIQLAAALDEHRKAVAIYHSNEQHLKGKLANTEEALIVLQASDGGEPPCQPASGDVVTDAGMLEDELGSREAEITGKDSRIKALEEQVASLTDERVQIDDVASQLREDIYGKDATIEQLRCSYVSSLSTSVYRAAKESAMEEIRWFSLNNDAGMMERVQLENEANMQTMAVLHEQIATLKDQCAAAEWDAETKLEASTDKCKDLTSKLKTKATKVAAYDKQIKQLKAKLATKEGELAAKEGELADLAALQAINGGVPPASGDVVTDAGMLEDALESREAEITGKDSRIKALEEQLAVCTPSMIGSPNVVHIQSELRASHARVEDLEQTLSAHRSTVWQVPAGFAEYCDVRICRSAAGFGIRLGTCASGEQVVTSVSDGMVFDGPGRLQVGDMILSINGTQVTALTHGLVLELCAASGTLDCVVERRHPGTLLEEKLHPKIQELQSNLETVAHNLVTRLANKDRVIKALESSIQSYESKLTGKDSRITMLEVNVSLLKEPRVNKRSSDSITRMVERYPDPPLTEGTQQNKFNLESVMNRLSQLEQELASKDDQIKILQEEATARLGTAAVERKLESSQIDITDNGIQVKALKDKTASASLSNTLPSNPMAHTASASALGEGPNDGPVNTQLHALSPRNSSSSRRKIVRRIKTLKGELSSMKEHVAVLKSGLLAMQNKPSTENDVTVPNLDVSALLETSQSLLDMDLMKHTKLPPASSLLSTLATNNTTGRIETLNILPKDTASDIPSHTRNEISRDQLSSLTPHGHLGGIQVQHTAVSAHANVLSPTQQTQTAQFGNDKLEHGTRVSPKITDPNFSPHPPQLHTAVQSQTFAVADAQTSPQRPAGYDPTVYPAQTSTPFQQRAAVSPVVRTPTPRRSSSGWAFEEGSLTVSIVGAIGSFFSPSAKIAPRRHGGNYDLI